MDDSHRNTQPAPAPRSRWAIGWIVFAAVAAWFLWAEHRAHLLAWLPFAIVLLCPLMHVFMHRGHRHRHGSAKEAGGPGSGVRDDSEGRR